MAITKIDTIPIMGRSLIEHDPASRSFPARGAIMDPEVRRQTKTWRRGSAAYNQGETSSCVGQSFKGVLNTSPHSNLVRNSVRLKYDALDFYRNGQENDEWPGAEPVYSGTSALGVCKYLKDIGTINEYRWCFGVDDVLDTLSQFGPVAIGVAWYQGMMKTDSNGFLQIEGHLVGGHEVELHGINVTENSVIGTNSWGPNWGLNGRFKISWIDLDVLLKNDGDAVTVTEVVPR